MTQGPWLESGPGREITVPAFGTFTDAYLAVLSGITGSHQYEIATRGNSAHEILNVSFTIADPLARSPYLGGAEGQHRVQPRGGAVVSVRP